jgi:hypothetical protein
MQYALAIVALMGLGLVACENRGPAVQPQGQPETLQTQVLEAGARVLQTQAPAGALDLYLVGFHPLVDDPSHVAEAHHYCRQVNEEFTQCAIWDGNTKDSNLIGVEYMISERLFQQLSAEERQSWHPHNYEILSGILRAPGLPPGTELAVMRSMLNSYGKTIHTWRTGPQGDTLPLGPAELAWSFNANGELEADRLEARDRAMRLSTERARQNRQSLVPQARPQQGVNALADRYPNRSPIPGVVDSGE